jgi:uncharacterized protein YegL
MRRTINFLINLGEDVPSSKYSVGFLLDLSGSMQGQPLDQAKIAINNFVKPIYGGENILGYANQLSIVTFHTDVQKVCPWIDETDFDFFREFLFGIPNMADVIMKETGVTALFDGMAEVLNSCYNDAKSENERIILIFSDGCNYGDKKYTKQEIKTLIEKYNNGFISKSLIKRIKKTYPKININELVKDVTDKDYYIFNKHINEELICKIISEPEEQQIVISSLKSSKKPFKICSLYYHGEYASSHGRDLLQEFADLTGGYVFDAPTAEAIPVVMQRLFHKLKFCNKSNIRNGLISRLKDKPIAENNDWFRVFSINSSDSNIKAPIENSSEHIVFNTFYKKCTTRDEALDQFKKTYNGSTYNFRKLLIDNLYNQNLSFGREIETNPLVFLTFRGQDILGSALVQYLYEVLDSIRSDPNNIIGTENSEYHFFLVILIDHLVNYSEEEKRNLAALLNEINTIDPDCIKIHGIFLLSERNDHLTANPDGYKTLSDTEFEQLVIETLFSLNVHQQLAISTYMENYSARQRDSSSYNRFLSTGNISVYLDSKLLSDKLSFRLCHDLLQNLYREDYVTNIDGIKSEIDNYLNDLSFSSLKNQILQGEDGLNLLSRFDCPSALESDFTNNWKELNLRYIDQSDKGISYFTSTLRNNSYSEYIQYLYFDVRNYVESCHSQGTYESVVRERVSNMLKFKTEQLQAITERMLYKGHLSSPRQAELWIDKLYERFDDYINNIYITDIKNDSTVKGYSDFSYKVPGLIITDDNPATPLNMLKDKLENFPLPLATRFKYYSLAGLFIIGILVFTIIGILPVAGLLSLLLPILILFYGEYRLYQNIRQIRKLIHWYGFAHRYRSRKKALDFIVSQINQMLVDIKNKVKKEDKHISLNDLYPENLSEYDYLSLFRKSLSESMTGFFNFELKASPGLSNFHINLSKGFYDDNQKKIEIIDDNNIKKLAGIEDIHWKDFFHELTQSKESIIKSHFPSIELSFIPPNFLDQLSTASTKPNINLSLKLHLKEVINEKLYYLTLYDTLNEEEISELKGIFNSKIWYQSIDLLINKYTNINYQQNDNFFSLWREVGFYQVWLNEISRIINENKKGSEIIKSDSIFKLWQNMYHPRKDFREKLIKNAQNILISNLERTFHIWKIIQQSDNKNKLTSHIKNWSFSPIYLTNPHNLYTNYSKLNYLSEQKYLSENLKQFFQKDILTLLNDNRVWQEFDNNYKNYLLFNHFVVIPVNDNSFLKNIAGIQGYFIGKDDAIYRKYFLSDFCDRYFKTQKQKKEFKWLFKH